MSVGPEHAGGDKRSRLEVEGWEESTETAGAIETIPGPSSQGIIES